MVLMTKVIQTVFLLFKEYFLNSDGKQKTLGARTVTVAVGASLILCSMVTIYLGEQAKQNLTIHHNIISQYNKVMTDNRNLKEQVTALENNLYSCEARANKAMTECQAALKNVGKRSEYIYDPVTKTMVEKKGS